MSRRRISRNFRSNLLRSIRFDPPNKNHISIRSIPFVDISNYWPKLVTGSISQVGQFRRIVDTDYFHLSFFSLPYLNIFN